MAIDATKFPGGRFYRESARAGILFSRSATGAASALCSPPSRLKSFQLPVREIPTPRLLLEKMAGTDGALFHRNSTVGSCLPHN